MRWRDWAQSGATLSTLLLLAPAPSDGFYLPGVAPTTYRVGDKVPLQVNHLTPSLASRDAQLHSVISFNYYHPAFHFCRPEGGAKDVRESLGSIIFGDRILTSPFELHMAQNETCKSLCEEKKFDPRSSKFVNRRIWQNYNMNWLIDGLPAAQLNRDSVTQEEFYSPGFSLGKVVNGESGNKEVAEVYLNNHYDILIDYHKAGSDQYRVVGVLVQPESRKGSKDLGGGKAECGDPALGQLSLSENEESSVTWTYSVYWRESSTAWATRWDKYLHVFDPRIHWFSLINSAIIVIFLVGTVSMVLLRALRKDIARYNRLDSFSLEDMDGTSAAVEDGVQEDSGWKLVHGDVFRPPKHPLLLSVFLGNGAQLFVMTGLTIAFALLGFLSPSNRGSLGTVMILLYTILGFVGGYVSARVYKTFGGEAWKRNIAMTPLLIPAIIFATFFLLNLFLWAKQSSGAVPFTTMLVIVSIWFIISVPLSFAGSWVGFRQPVSACSLPNRVLFPWFPQKLKLRAGHPSTNPRQPNPTTDPSFASIPSTPPLPPPYGRPPIRRHICRSLFHYDIHLDLEVLLYVRLPLHLLRPHDHHLRRNDHLIGLFPPLR